MAGSKSSRSDPVIDATPPQMPEMVERVAEALKPFFSGADLCYGEHQLAARAAIEAMREPTPEMLSAADGAEIAGYIAMIDAAIGGLVASPNVDDGPGRTP